MKYSKSLALYNFDHGFDRPGTIRFGLFEIKISQTNILSASKLSRRATTGFTWSPQGNPIVSKTSAKVGKISKTATVRRVYSTSDTVPQSSSSIDPSEVGDLCLLLSFLTGRRVFQNTELSGLEGGWYGEPVVGRNYFLTLGSSSPDMGSLQREDLFPILWAMVNSNSTNDMIGKICYASASLDSISTRWFKSEGQGYSKDERAAIDGVRKKVEAVIRSDLGDSPIAGDALPRVSGIFTPSALMKLRCFLTAQGFLSSEPCKDEMDRLRLLNSIRNRVVHSADIPSDIHKDFNRRGEIAASVLAIIGEICSVYISKVAGIGDFQINKSKEDILAFFKSGIFRGHKVFDEDYETFSARLEASWLNGNGI
ncbi:hypothetical protein WJ542_13045 [Paraburkholderia sp. B3]|uniref:hypothetical protein n=1 Tax=Paraburkholderia sp. B3 TaxID=3134791 RepID=UPI0039820DC4